ncbi:hypothetical protein D3C87_1654700 [compost metagenome]
MLALQLAVDLRPIWFRRAAMSYLRPGPPVEGRLQDCVADVVTKGPRQASNRCTP